MTVWDWHPEAKIKKWQADKYFEVLKLSIYSYTSKYIMPKKFILSKALGLLAIRMRLNIYNLNMISPEQAICSKDYQLMESIGEGIRQLLILVWDDPGFRFHDLSLNVHGYKENDISLHGQLAKGITEMLIEVSSCQILFDMVKFIIDSLTFEKNRMSLIYVRENIYFLIKKQIHDLLNPSLIACLIYVFGLCEPDKTPDTLHKEVMQSLKLNFLTAYKKIPCVQKPCCYRI